MGLFDQVLGAIADPRRQASAGQMAQILGSAKQLAQQNNADTDTMQQAMSVIGRFVRTSLQEKRQQSGDDAAQALLDQGSADGAAVIPQLFNSAQLNDMIAAVTRKTNLNSSQVQGLLPVILPLVMRFLSAGNAKQGMPADGNPILTAFLDGDGDGDMGDMLGMAGKFM